MIPTADVKRIAPHSFSGATVYCWVKNTSARPSPAWMLPGPSPTMAPTMLAVAVIFMRREQVRQRCRESHLPEDRPSRRGVRAHQLQRPRVGRTEAAQHGDRHREEAQVGGDDHDARHVVPDEEHDQRGEGDDRDRLAGDHVRHEGPLDQAEVDEGHGQRNAQQATDREADERLARGVQRSGRTGSRPGSARRPEVSGWKRRSKITHTWGRLMSLAIPMSSGGVQTTCPSTRYGSPPSNLNPSHRTTRPMMNRAKNASRLRRPIRAVGSPSRRSSRSLRRPRHRWRRAPDR